MSVAESQVAELHIEETSGLWRDAFERFRHNKGAIFGVVLLTAFVLAAIFAPAISPFDPNKQVGALAANPAGPGGDHLMGLDEQGRDLFSRLLFGARLSLLVGVVSVTVGLALGLLLGALAGYFGGWVDAVIMRLMDIMLTIPSLLLAVGIVTLLGRGLVQIMVAVGLVSVPLFARLLRATLLAQRESDYVLAARSVGASGPRLLLVHMLPNSLAPLIVTATLAMATAIIEVAALSFLGLGPNDPGLPEWGAILANNASRLQESSHLVFFPGFAIVFSVLALNLIGDGLREALDPKLRS